MKCALVGNRIYTSVDLTDRTVNIVGKAYDADLTIQELGDRYTLSFTYYVLARYYANIENAEKATYYHSMFEREWIKVGRPVKAIIYQGIGTDL